MLKKFFLAMGVVFTCLIASCTLFLGFATNEAPKNKGIAETITRDMARAWNVNDVKPHFVAIAQRQVNFAEAQLTFNRLKALGMLKRIEQAQQTEFRFKDSGGVLTKTATIVLVTAFENGRAQVTMRLASEGAEMKLWHVDVTPIGEIIRAKNEQA